MKRRKVILFWISLLLCAAMLCSCQQSSVQSNENSTGTTLSEGEAAAPQSPVQVDENGVATWQPVEGAVAYGYCFVDGEYCSIEELQTTETHVQLPKGYSVHYWPLFENGERGSINTSDYYGEPVTDAVFQQLMEQPLVFQMDENGVVTWEKGEYLQGYQYCIEDAYGNISAPVFTEEPMIQLTEGTRATVYVKFVNGWESIPHTTEFFGDVDAALVVEQPAPDQADGEIVPEENGVVVTLSVDEQGVVTWEPIPEATGYEYALLDGDGMYFSGGTTTGTKLYLTKGTRLDVRPLMPDQPGGWTSSPYYGEPATLEYYQVTAPLLHLDENGLLSWEGLEETDGYEITYIKDYLIYKTVVTKDTTAQLPEGFKLDIRPIINGETGQVYSSAVYGDVLPSAEEILDITQYASYDFVPAIDPASYTVAADGTVTFTAEGPEGSLIRFEGSGIELVDGGISFSAEGTLMALDAIGTIYAMRPTFAANDDASNSYSFIGGIDPMGNTAVDNAKALLTMGFGLGVDDRIDFLDVDVVSANYFGFTANPYNAGSFVLSGLDVYYSTHSYHTPIREIGLDASDYGTYLEGERYALEKEGRFSIEDKVYDFRLQAVPDTEEACLDETGTRYMTDIEKHLFSVGDLKDKNGVVLDKETAIVEPGTTLEVTVGQYTYDVALPVLSRYSDAQTTYELSPYATISAVGDVNVLVIPIAWQDESHTYNDETMLRFKQEMGRVTDLNGNVEDYSDQLLEERQRFSLSHYYEIASYGNLNVTSYMTDWYPAPYDFASMKNSVPDDVFFAELMDWLYTTYPDFDWSQVDLDANGYIDSMILVNAGDNSADMSFMPMSFGGGVQFTNSYTDDKAGSTYRPTVNNYIVCHAGLFDGNVIVHEFGHTLGLVDYYDVLYSGINAVGSYDMQSNNFGDWNPYSKYAVGWIDPVIVTGLEPGETQEITIGSMSVTGDAIVIPAAEAQQDGTPFNEYIMIDLFTDEGLHQYDASACGLDGAKGVRIYHVNAVMERRELTHEVAGDKVFPIGTIHVSNASKDDGLGQYLIELIQCGGDNTFTDLTNLRTDVQAKDFFTAGDVFTAEEYDEFLYEGKMDDGTDFGYTVKVVSIETNEAGETTAVISVTRQE